ncbi:iron-enterobactin ABC transporter permease [Gynuella sunshinyii]|uniref:ABC-type enterobactin transport system, permease component n=1 Tax=Gynuella sunshinyii YC6258 TaxID=1445510 RepID=A0A0C5VKU0_9GAMM|nr:iron-enterobactin ABC transporter permease [Gynuella sunshinyii]AJQ94921.1 ABC-type enterobactin transport system, permease component [Gynuella sunshinyii YC6258]
MNPAKTMYHKPNQYRLGLIGLILVCSTISIIALSSGQLTLSASQLLQALMGSGPEYLVTVVTQWRLPRIFMAMTLGAALGISGTIFQSLIRNPLGSPDVIGFNTGSYTGVIVTIILFGGHYFHLAAGALIGGIGSAALVYLLAYRQGVQGFRLIIVGIAISAMLTALNTWMLISASLESAMSAALWGAGTLNGITWNKGIPAAMVIFITIFFATTLTTRMRLLEMGDDAANALGVAAERTRLWLMLAGVALTAAVTAAAGPVSFIALAAPQLAKRLTGSHSVTFPAAGLMGATLLLTADFLSQTLFAPNQLPVGVVTVSIGGIYLVWLLLRESKSL